MLFSEKINNLSQKQQRVWVIVLMVSAAVLSIPLPFIMSYYDIHLYFIFTIISSMLLAFKFSGIFNELSETAQCAAGFVVFLIAPMFIAYFIETVDALNFVLRNVIIILIPYILLFFIFRTSVIPVVSVSVMCMLLHAVDNILFTVRGTGLNLFDFFAWRTAFSVSSNYKYVLSESVYYSLLGTVTIIIASGVFPFRLKNIKKSAVRICLVASVAFILVFSAVGLVREFIRYNFIISWINQDIIMERGICYNLVLRIKDYFVNPPEGYSKNEAKKILDGYLAETVSDDAARNPNIIVIMNESFSDLPPLYDAVPVEAYMPYYCSFDKNVTKGRVIVSALGGGTANSEYEFLTGHSMAFMPKGSYPYLQYINDDIETVFRSLNKSIYPQNVYIHPFIASNYKRSSIFQFLGFDVFYDGLSFSGQDFYSERYSARVSSVKYDGVNMVRDFIGDKMVYDKVIDLYEHKPDGTRTAQFVVTMQNHSDYYYAGDNFQNEAISDLGIDYIDQFLTLMKISDRELKRLTDYFSKVDEDTVIVFFGDHQPSLNIYHKDPESEYIDDDEALSMFSTPFLIWTNFETETEELDYISLNYLSILMKEKAGMSLNEYDRFRMELMNKYPVISSNIIIDNDGNTYRSISEVDDDMMREYEYLQYYYMFET